MSDIDLDKIVDAFAAYVDAVTYREALRSADERNHRERTNATADRVMELRGDAVRAEHTASVALYALLPHETAMRLIQAMGEARWGAEQRGEVAYAEAVAESMQGSEA